MTFKLGDYVKHIEYPKSKVPLRLSDQKRVDIANAQKENFTLATKEEHENYWEESE